MTERLYCIRIHMTTVKGFNCYFEIFMYFFDRLDIKKMEQSNRNMIIIIIIIIILVTTFKQCIYNYIPVTNHVSTVYNVTAIL